MMSLELIQGVALENMNRHQDGEFAKLSSVIKYKLTYLHRFKKKLGLTVKSFTGSKENIGIPTIIPAPPQTFLD